MDSGRKSGIDWKGLKQKQATNDGKIYYGIYECE